MHDVSRVDMEYNKIKKEKECYEKNIWKNKKISFLS